MLRAPRRAPYVKANLPEAKSIASYCHYLMMKGQLCGNFCFDGHKPTREEDEVAEQCRRMCDKITLCLDRCKVSEIPELLAYYDFAFRIGNKSVPDKSLIDKCKRQVFKAWQAGDKIIDESTVYGLIMPEVAYRPANADREYYAAYRAIKDKWLLTLKRHGSFTDATTYENYQRLALMMRENIDEAFGDKSESVKRRWYDRNKIEDFSKVSSPILRSYRRFASSLFPAVLDYETQLTIDNRILTTLTTRPDLSPHDRDAFAMALHYNKELNQ